MPDSYPDFAALAARERPGIDFRVLVRSGASGIAIVAPHGGGIEPGTSELADAVAGAEHPFYAFEGLKIRSNAGLHITSTRFDEPQCLALIARARTVVTLHGERSGEEGVFVGGLDDALGARITQRLRAAGFAAGPHPNVSLRGIEPSNIVNRGALGAGVQLEISRGLRGSLFESLSRAGRLRRTTRFAVLVEALRGALAQSD